MVSWTKRNFFIGFTLVACAITYQFIFRDDNQEVIDYYKGPNFSAVVSKKFIDADNNSRSLVLLSIDGTEQTMCDNFDRSGFYDYTMLGDSLLKRSQELKIMVTRNGVDTVFELQLK